MALMAMAVCLLAAAGDVTGAAAAAILKTSVSSFRNNEPVTVTVSNSGSPTMADVVALYFTGANITAVKPLKVDCRS